jgi:threonine/homoserine/homoserine lactone efflux protein
LSLLKIRRFIITVIMDINFFLKGCLIGLSIAAPVGPIGVLCIRRSLNHGMLIGFFTGLGAATADCFYGAIAGFGLTLLSGVLVKMSTLLQIFGGVFLWYLGFKTFFRGGNKEEGDGDSVKLVHAYITTFFLTLTNPATIISFVAVFAGLGIGGSAGNYTSATLLTLGVFVGSAAWWLLLSNVVSLLRLKITNPIKSLINTASAVILVLFGIYAVFHGFSGSIS